MACVDREADSSRRANCMGMEMIFMVRTLLIVVATFVGVSHLSAQPLEYFGKPVRGIPVSGAVKVGKFVFVSGTPAFGEGGKLAVGDFSAQMKQVMENMTGVLKASGTDWSRVVKTNVLLMRASDFSEMNQIYSTYFAEGKYPARTTMVVAGLPHPDFLLEIECEAVLE
jgi:2-iminobutanoate/2-iminopropanoate deaminase